MVAAGCRVKILAVEGARHRGEQADSFIHHWVAGTGDLGDCGFEVVAAEGEDAGGRGFGSASEVARRRQLLLSVEPLQHLLVGGDDQKAIARRHQHLGGAPLDTHHARRRGSAVQ